MVITKIGENEVKVTLNKEELKKAFSTPRNYYNFMKELHKKLGIPWLDELDVLEWVISTEKEE